MQQRSPVTFWLLLAATLSVDAVVTTWIVQDFPYHLSVAFHALILGQLGVVCIWSANCPMPTVWSRLAPLIAAIIAAVWTLYAPFPLNFRGLEAFRSYLGFYGLYSVLLLAGLWLLQRTKFWSSRTGVFRAWQYSLGHVLLVMTIVALLAASMRHNPFFNDSQWVSIISVASYVAIGVANVLIWTLSWHWVLRMAGVFAAALLLGLLNGAILLLISPEWNSDTISFVAMPFAVYNLIQALVFSIWLGCGPILPISPANGSAENERHERRPQ